MLWVWFCAYLNCAGWTLSALHELNAAGYAVALIIFFATTFLLLKTVPPRNFPANFHFKRISRRFCKSFPLAFLILAAMEILCGILYPPTNYDALAYRLPRILHWLADGQWHWIHTFFYRVNNRSCGIEWISAPVIALLKTDLPLFLINVISFLFLPGLVFSVFTRLGVRLRVAWHWMWIVPTGYCFLLQAASIGNDLFGATFVLAAVDFALRANNGERKYFYVSILAAAMMTSAKISNLPLLLPWALAILPVWKMILRPAAISVCAIAIFASALPTIYLNQKFSGDWSGAGLNQKTTVAHPIVLRSGAETVLLALENFVPPIFPQSQKWNTAANKNIPPQLEEELSQLIESPGDRFHLPQMQMEESAVLGFGVCALLLVSFFAAFFLRDQKSARKLSWQTLIRWSPLVSLSAVLLESNLSAVARLFTPYYALVIPIVIAGNGHDLMVKKIWWRIAAFLVFVMVATLIVISPARPLFPAQTLLQKFSAGKSESKWFQRINEVYSVYENRNDAFAPARAALSPNVTTFGAVLHDDPETSLWRPFGPRRVVHVCPGDTADYLKSRGVQFIFLPKETFTQWFNFPLDDWLKQMNAQIVQTIPLNLRASVGPTDWYLVRLN